MRVAVVGAGLAGLGVTYFLLKRGYLVTLFDERGVGGGASGIPIGLCHPYLGRSGKPSKFAGEALLLTNELIIAAENSSKKKLADRSGILRVDWTPYEMYSDLEKVDEGILIKSGMTVFLKEYVECVYSHIFSYCSSNFSQVIDGFSLQKRRRYSFRTWHLSIGIFILYR